MSDMLLTAYNGAILGPIAKVLGWVMNGIYALMSMIGIENVGLSIIIFTIVIYAILFPLTYKQQKFSKLSQKMQPELQAIQKKYNGKKDQASMMAMQEETQAVYEKYGVSMMGSCVQMLIQMPLLFALYRVFLNVPAYVSGVKNNFSTLVDGIMATSGYQDKMTQLVTDLKKIELEVRNTGSSLLKDIQLSANKPADWEVTFEPSKIDALKAGETSTVMATLKASKKALPGDYVTTIMAKTPEVNADAQFRVAVKTPMIWGWVGVLIIIATIGVVYYLFRKYGRR